MTNEGPVRIAMWSGPRNISTAMMRSFENRSDCAVWDEPFYAAYLKATGLNHPMREDVIADGISDWQEVRAAILGDAPDNAAIFYQKHMSHHLIDGVDRSWIPELANCFLIRRPENVLASYAAKREDVTLRDIGFVEQSEIFDQVADALGAAPPVVEANDVLTNPDSHLPKVCAALGIAFDDAMLKWPTGRRSSDGVWARHWYGTVERSTNFAPPGPDTKRSDLPGELARIAEKATPIYEKLLEFRIR